MNTLCSKQKIDAEAPINNGVSVFYRGHVPEHRAAKAEVYGRVPSYL